MISRMFILIHFLMIYSLSFAGTGDAQTKPHPAYWDGKPPLEKEATTEASLLSHPYFTYMEIGRRYFYPRDFIQRPSWVTNNNPIQWANSDPWVYYALHGCEFTEPAEVVGVSNPNLEGENQDYITFVGKNCRSMGRKDIEFDTATYVLPALMYNSDNAPDDPTIYLCTEGETQMRLFATTLTYEYYPAQRRSYYIGKVENMRFHKIEKTSAERICSSRSASLISRDLVTALYRSVSAIRSQPQGTASGQSEACYWKQQEICPANGGPCIYPNEFVCE